MDDDHQAAYFPDDIDSSCSTPFASAPSSPGRSGGGGGYFFSAPASPIHHLLLSSSPVAGGGGGAACGAGQAGDAEFEFGGPGGPMISADELFLNGQIRPLKLSPLPDLDPGTDDDGEQPPPRGRDLTLRSGSVHRRARSMSPLRNTSPRFKLLNALVAPPDISSGAAAAAGEAAPPVTASSRSSSSSSTSSSSSSSSTRGSRRWVFLKDILLPHRSKGDAGHDPAAAKADRLWPFSPSWASRNKAAGKPRAAKPPHPAASVEAAGRRRSRAQNGRSATVAAAHERLYAAPNRVQAEEMRRRTFLPYRQGLLGCLGFSSRGYGALHGFTKTLNPVFSR